MFNIKLFFDTLSQPSRALRLFLLMNKIPHEAIAVNLFEGEHLREDYLKIHPFGKVPALEHNGFLLTESVAILRYLCRELNVPDHWYPQDSRKQARVDEYLEWQHNNTRQHCATYVQMKIFRPIVIGKPADEKMVKTYQKYMERTLDQIANVWLKNHKYLCGDSISIADLLGVTELEQPRMAGYNVGKDRPVLKAYMERVKSDLQPHYSDVMKRFEEFIRTYPDLQKQLTSKM